MAVMQSKPIEMSCQVMILYLRLFKRMQVRKSTDFENVPAVNNCEKNDRPF